MESITAEKYIGIGHFLKCRRKFLGISKEIFCKEMGISKEILEKWENDYLENIGLGEMKKIAKLLKYSPLIFIDGVSLEAYKNWQAYISQAYIE